MNSLISIGCMNNLKFNVNVQNTDGNQPHGLISPLGHEELEEGIFRYLDVNSLAKVKRAQKSLHKNRIIEEKLEFIKSIYNDQKVEFVMGKLNEEGDEKKDLIRYLINNPQCNFLRNIVSIQPDDVASNSRYESVKNLIMEEVYRIETLFSEREKQYELELSLQERIKILTGFLQNAPIGLLKYGMQKSPQANVPLIVFASTIIPSLFSFEVQEGTIENFLELFAALSNLIVQKHHNVLYSHFAHNSIKNTQAEKILYFLYFLTKEEWNIKKAKELIKWFESQHNEENIHANLLRHYMESFIEKLKEAGKTIEEIDQLLEGKV